MSKPSVKDFGAVGDGLADDSANIQKALAASSHVYVPPGNYACHTMIEIHDGKTLELAGGATLFRPAKADSNDPVVWIKGTGCGVFGAGQSQSTIRSERRAPKGVVRLGHKDMTESHGNVLYNTLRDLTISGAKPGGQSGKPDIPDVALYMPNPQFSDDAASYFHNISGLIVERANYGIWLHGWANGNTISNIQGRLIGNTSSNHRAFIFDNGGLDNTISNCQFHASAGSVGLYIASFDNKNQGGHVHSNYASSYRGLIFEQGDYEGQPKVRALGLVSKHSKASFFEIRHNVSGGNEVEDGFYKRNYFFGLHVPDGGETASKEKINTEGTFAHKEPVKILSRTFRSALVTVTYECEDNGNFTRSDLLLLSVRAEEFSPSAVEVVKTAQFNTGVPGEIEKVTYTLVAPGATLNATLTATVERLEDPDKPDWNPGPGRFKASGYQTA